MDWDKKFSTIIDETEANLERVRRRLDTARTVTGSTNPDTNADYPITDSKDMQIGGKTVSLESQKIPAWAVVLEEKFAKQKKIIETLTETVVFLQAEKDRQKVHINDLKDALLELQDRVAEKGVDVNTENKIRQWKQETRSELELLREQVRNYQRSSSSPPSGRPSIDDLQHQVREVKSKCQDENDHQRKDIDLYKTKLARLETAMSVMNEQLVDLNKKHKEMRENMLDLTESSRRNYKDLALVIKEKLNDIHSTREEVSRLKHDLSDSKEKPLHMSTPTQSVKTSAPPIIAVQQANSQGKAFHQGRWRDLLSHSFSSLSLESSDSSLSSGYVARKRSEDNRHMSCDQADLLEEPDLDDSTSLPSTPSSLSLSDL